jgi:hypothetical protein
MKTNHSNKKSPTNPVKKEAHEGRKVKARILHEIEDTEQQQAILEFKKNETNKNG